MAPEIEAKSSSLILAAKRPLLTLLVAGLIAAAAAAGASRLRTSASLGELLARDHKPSIVLNRIHNAFPATDDLTLLVTSLHIGASNDEARNRLLAFAARLEHLIRSSDELSRLCRDISYRADQHGTVREFVESSVLPNGLLYLSEEAFADARRRLSAEAIHEQIERNEALITAPSPTADAVADLVLRDPLRLKELIGRESRAPDGGVLFSLDGRSLLVRMTGARPSGDLEFCREFVRRIRDAVRGADPRGLTVEYTGAYAITDLSARSIRRDMTVSVILSVAFIQILFLVADRNLLSFPIAFVPVALGILVGFGVFSLFASSITALTSFSHISFQSEFVTRFPDHE